MAYLAELKSESNVRAIARRITTTRAAMRRQIVTWLLVGAAGLVATVMPVNAQVRDVTEVGNDVAIDLNSVARVLNNRTCLSPDEKSRIYSYLAALEIQIGSDKEQLSLASRSIAPAAEERARDKLDNLKNEIARDEKEVKDRPLCPPGEALNPRFGLYIGGHLIKNWGLSTLLEDDADTGAQTNKFTDHADPVGGGFLIGYRLAPLGANIVVSPFASFDFMHAPVNHTFAGGSFLGTTANFMGTFGVKVGPQFDAFWLYGIGGAGVLNETLNINFLPVASAQSSTVPGGIAGFGGAWQPNFLQGFGLPVSVFAEYQHFWWADATFNRPAASPNFNYTFRRQDDLVKIGFTVDLFPPLPPLTPAGPKYVKALPPK
jgi:hypothetical protein